LTPSISPAKFFCETSLANMNVADPRGVGLERQRDQVEHQTHVGLVVAGAPAGGA
jgi:hypothetical protein